jgi:hypothetical protein
MKKKSLAILVVAIMTSLIIPVYAKKPARQPKLKDVVLKGAINWSGENSVTNNKIGIGLRVDFRNKEPDKVKFVGDWPGILNAQNEPVYVTPSEHLAVNTWRERAQQIELARVSLTFYDEGGVEWLLKAEGTENYKVPGGIRIILTGFSISKVGEPIPHYDTSYGPLEFTFTFS